MQKPVCGFIFLCAGSVSFIAIYYNFVAVLKATSASDNCCLKQNLASSGYLFPIPTASHEPVGSKTEMYFS